jgi:TatA/E family protein of Tat protein translocase
MLNLDPAKLLVIAVVAIILLGPDRLPQVARQVGAAWRSFNEFRHRMEAEVRSTMPDLPPTHEIARLARSPSALLNKLSSMNDGDGNGTEANGTVAGEVAGVGDVDGAGAGVGGNGNSSSLPDGVATTVDGPVLDGPVVDGPVVRPDGVVTGPDGVAESGLPAPAPPRPAPRTASPAPAPEIIEPGDPTLN